jgi:hypothetical protein
MNTLEKEIIKTNLTENYISYWSLAQGIKEATQNVVYGAVKSNSKPKIEYKDGFGYIEDDYKGFEKKYLYLGESQQRSDENGLGNFGEGWKMFLLICSRNNIPHQVETVGFTFNGKMVDTPHGVKTLEIEIFPNQRKSGTMVFLKCEEQDFISGTRGFALNQGIEKEHCGDLSLIPNRKNELYINGVLIENSETTNPLNLEYSYHIKDRSLMNRDRSQVDIEKARKKISSVWSLQHDKDIIKCFINKALSGETRDDIQYGPSPYEIPYNNRDIWLESIAELLNTTKNKLVRSSRDNELDSEVLYRGYVIVNFPDKWSSVFYVLGIPDAHDIVTTKIVNLKIYRQSELLDSERKNLSKAKKIVRKALKLKTISDLPDIEIVKEIKDSRDVVDGLGMYDSQLKKIYLKREILKQERELVRVLIHESIHWETNGAKDGSSQFIHGFENAILNLLGY